MGRMLIEIKTINGAENMSAMLDFHLPFDRSSVQEFLEKVIDIKETAEGWEGVSLVGEWACDYVDVRDQMQKFNLKSNNPILQEIKRKKAITNDMSELVHAIKQSIKKADSFLY